MFNTAVRRIMWKEFRAQRAVWIAIAVELALLQFWWAVNQNRIQYINVNLFSVAFVLTGVFAMTSSALLFAGESESHTDGFLRQLPFRSRELLLGKLGYSFSAVLAFLAFGTITTLAAAAIAGRFGGEVGTVLGEPLVFANGIVGLWAWGMFYSLVTRRVIWTVIGAAATEILVNAIIHGILASIFSQEFGTPFAPQPAIYSTYWGITLTVILIDAWLLSKWYTRDNSVGALQGLGLAPDKTLSSAELPPLPWYRIYRSCALTGIVAGVLLLVGCLIVSTNAQPLSSQVTLLLLLLCVVIAAGIVKTMSLVWPQLTAGPVGTERGLVPSSPVVAPITLSRVKSFVGLLGLGLISLIGGLVASYTGLAFVAMTASNIYETWFGLANHVNPTSGLGFLVLICLGSSLGLYWGGSIIRGLTGSPTSAWTTLLQLLQSFCHRMGKSWGSLLWIEARRALPVVVVGAIYMSVVVGLSSRTSNDLMNPFFNLGLVSLICGLMTLLPDRTHGSLAFLHERGVSARSILASKLLVWGVALLLMVVVPLSMNSALRNNLYSYSLSRVPLAVFEIQTPVMVDTSRFGGMWLILLGIGGGMFTWGFLCAAWIRRPVLAVLSGVVAAILWSGWLGTLTNIFALSDSFVLGPLILLIIGVFWTGSSSLLEQVNWKSRLGRVVWVLLVCAFAFQSLFHFRANEIPIVEVPHNIRGGSPSPTGLKLVSSWPPEMSEDAFDRLSESNNLIQPPGFWSSENSFRVIIQRLRLEEDACDLDASIEHLHKWLLAVNQMSRNSRNEDGWVECLKTQRVLLSAVRRWANHPKQTAERLDTAANKLSKLELAFGSFAIQHEYADAQRALNQGIPMDSQQTQPTPFTFERLFLSLTGEKQRVRRLVDYYYTLTANSHVAEDPNLGQSYSRWLATTAASCYAFGVHLSPRTFTQRHRGQMEMAFSATRATVLVLRLQSWRCQHGQFPNSLVSILPPGETATDTLTMADFGYEFQGFDRHLRVAADRAVPANQPILYSLGVNQPRGIAIQNRGGNEQPFYTTLNWLMESYPALNAQQARDSSQYALTGKDVVEIAGTANPLQIRFVILGQKNPEDSLDLVPKDNSPQPVAPGGEVGAAAMEAGGMMEGSSGLQDAGESGATISEAPPEAAPVAPTTDAPNYNPPVPPSPPESQPKDQ